MLCPEVSKVALQVDQTGALVHQLAEARRVAAEAGARQRWLEDELDAKLDMISELQVGAGAGAEMTPA